MILWIHKVLFWSRELMFRLLIAPRPLTIPLRTMRRSRNWTKTILTCGQRHTTSFYLFLYLFRSCSGFFTFCVLAPPLYLCFCGWHLLFSLSPVFCVPCLSSPPFPILHHLPLLLLLSLLSSSSTYCVCACLCVCVRVGGLPVSLSTIVFLSLLLCQPSAFYVLRLLFVVWSYFLQPIPMLPPFLFSPSPLLSLTLAIFILTRNRSLITVIKC